MSPKARPNPDAPPEPEGLADALLAPSDPRHPDFVAHPDTAPAPAIPAGPAPDGTTWATYLGTALGGFLADPLHQPAPWEQWRAWDAAGRPER